MARAVNTIEQAAELRRRAEDMAQRRAGPPPADPESTLPPWVVQVLQELRGHKCELELQIEELRRTQQPLETVPEMGFPAPHSGLQVRLIPRLELDSDKRWQRRVLNEWRLGYSGAIGA